jgi:ribose-phosphate pyrophosphokinase
MDGKEMNRQESQFELSIFSGTANPVLAESMAKCMGVELGKVDIRRFPDGEIHIKIQEGVRGKDVFVVQSVCNSPNEALMELLIMIDTMRRASAERVTAVLPFYGYARQDRKDQPGVPITAKLVANLLVAAGADRVLTIDLHAQQIQGYFDIPVDHLYAFPVISKYLLAKKLKNPVVVSPDTGGVKTAYAYSNLLECGLAIVAKQRKGATEVEALSLVGDVEGCTAVMVDDLTATAGTFCAAAKILKENGAGDIYAAVTHGMITQMGVERVRDSEITELIVTDTVPTIDAPGVNLTKLSIAPLLAEAITRIHHDRSVSSLFRS